MAGALIWLNVGVVEKSFAIFDAREGVTDVRFASTDGFDLTALQLDASLVALENVIIAQRLAIKNRLGSHDRALKRDGNSGAVRGILDRFVGELAGDDFLERNVGERSARTYLHHRPMSQTELTHALGDNVDQELLIWDDLGCFLEELSRHIAQRMVGDSPARTKGVSGGASMIKGVLILRAAQMVVNRFVRVLSEDFARRCAR